MASFKLYLEDTLVTPITEEDLLHYTDQSENPTDKIYYFGSVVEDNQLVNADNPEIDFITITPTDVLPEWAAATAYILGDRIQQVGGGSFVFQCTTAGTSHATTEPAWGGMGGLGSTIADNTVVWTKKAAHHQPTEITLALTAIALDTNTPGDPLDVTQLLEGGVATAIPIYVRIINEVTTVSNTGNVPEIALKLNNTIEITP